MDAKRCPYCGEQRDRQECISRVEDCSCPERVTDLICYGIHICKDGKRIAPEDFYIENPEVALDRLSPNLEEPK